MENQVKTPNPVPATPAVPTETAWLEWVTDDLMPRHGKTVWIVLGAIAVSLMIYLFLDYKRETSALEDNKKLGQAYVFLGQENLPEAEKALVAFLSHGSSGLAADKARLYLGKVYYGQQQYEKALEAYSKVGRGNSKTVLIYAGALHGRAACLMQKSDYAGAIKILEEFISLTMRRTGDPDEAMPENEIADLTPSVSNALWKQALCHRALKQTDPAKAAAEKILKVYPKAPEAQDAAKLLALME